MNESKATQTYRKYITEGPDACQLSESLEALEFRDNNPAEARRVEARVERERRDAAEKEDLRHAWLRDGGDEIDFAAAHKELTAREKAERLSAMDREAREASRRAVLEGF
jgi:hypothetical protein